MTSSVALPTFFAVDHSIPPIPATQTTPTTTLVASSETAAATDSALPLQTYVFARTDMCFGTL